MPSFLVTSPHLPNYKPQEKQWPGPRTDWLTARDVSAVLRPFRDPGLSCSEKQIEQQYELIALTFHRSRFYPAFQFDARGRVRPGSHELAQTIAESLQTPAGVGAVIRWLFSEQKALEGARPCDRFFTKPQQVIDSAHLRFVTKPTLRAKKKTRSRTK